MQGVQVVLTHVPVGLDILCNISVVIIGQPRRLLSLRCLKAERMTQVEGMTGDLRSIATPCWYWPGFGWIAVSGLLVVLTTLGTAPRLVRGLRAK